jgi:O-antigen ligase
MLALALQAQATVPVGASGLRVAVSDLLLPIVLLYAAIGWGNSESRPQWRTGGTYFWLLGLIVIMSIALAKGYHEFGRWSVWAVTNKWGGWIALTGYFIVGGSIVRAGGLELRTRILHVFLAAAAAVACINAAAMPWLLPHYTLPAGIEFGRATGGLQNSNAFGFLLVVACMLVIATQHRVALYLPALLTALWFTSSRGAVLSLAAGTMTLLLLHPRRLTFLLRPVAVSVLAISAIMTIAIAVNPKGFSEAMTGSTPIGFFSAERIDPDADTINKRRAQTARAIDMFVAAPILGHGLGYYIETTGQTLHNSLLWLLLELGLVGTIGIVGFLLLCLREIYRGRDDPYLLGMVAVAVAFMAMSVTGEFLYQRHLWLLLGMAVALSPAQAARQ